MMAMDVAEDCESMGVPVEAYSNVEQLCKKHSKVSSSKATKQGWSWRYSTSDTLRIFARVAQNPLLEVYKESYQK